MGGRKKNKVEKTAPKKRVPIKFDCEFCGDEKTVGVKIIKENGRRQAIIMCRMCKKKWTYPFVKAIDQPIDIYIKGLEYLRNKNKTTQNNDDEDDDSLKQDEDSLQQIQHNNDDLDSLDDEL